MYNKILKLPKLTKVGAKYKSVFECKICINHESKTFTNKPKKNTTNWKQTQF